MDQGRRDRGAGNSFIVWLKELSAADVEVAGGKAANLAEMMREGLPVPEGFVVTTAAFARFVEESNLDGDASPEAVRSGVIPPEVATAVSEAVASMGDTVLAVRSSGVGEDLADASFAGQYESFLDVHGEDAVLAAVRSCWASAFGERVTAYRIGRAQRRAAMAVLVQRLVPAEAAGVAFSANPVTGDRGEVLVSSVRGLGERLVSGQASPDEWRVRGNEVTSVSAPEKAISEGQARAIAVLATRAEAHYGVPQDIEWAIAAGSLYLLQTRPITTLPEEALAPIPVPVEVPPGYWEREGGHWPAPPYPMHQSIHLNAFDAGMREAMDEVGALTDGIEFRTIGGWVYRRLVPFQGRDTTPPVWLMPVLARTMPALRSRLKRFLEFVRTDEELPHLRAWHKERKPALGKRIAELRGVPLSSLSDTALEDHLIRTVAFFDESFRYHLLLAAIWAGSVIKFVNTCRDVLGWSDARILELVSGLSEESSEPTRALGALAQMARERPAVADALQHIGEHTMDTLTKVDPTFVAAFEAYRQEYGCRCLQYDLDAPTLAELPQLLLRLLADQTVSGFDAGTVESDLVERRAAAVSEAREALTASPSEEREQFERALTTAQLAYPVRQDNSFYTDGAPRALIRYALLELGARMAARSQLAVRDDIHFLELQEALSVFREGTDAREIVARRKAERAWIVAHPGPVSYGRDPGDPPIAWLPEDGRRFIETQMWMLEEVYGAATAEEQRASASALTGVAASPGCYTGTVRVIMDESEFGKLQPNDVLVCPTTSPVWSILFPNVGALVTDSGGTLSHPAIVAREYKVPAVVATANATARLHDGQTVTVDGSTGQVQVVV